MINTERLGILGIVVGVGAIAYSSYVHWKVNKTNYMIGAAVDDISKGIKIDIPEAMVQLAVNDAVEREVNEAVQGITQDLTKSMRRDIKDKVKDSVDTIYDDIKENVSKEVSKEVAQLDIERLRREVKEKAKDEVLGKFNENLDAMLQDFNQNLTNVSKIYSSIADNMVRKPQETILRVGN